jgi:hypothetical protein
MRSILPLRPAAALLLAAGACSQLLTIDIEQSAETVVPGSALGGLLGALDFTGFTDLEVSIDTELQNAGVAPGDVRHVYVTQLTLSTPDGDDLAFLSSLAVYVSAEGLDTVRIASLDAFPDGVATLDMALDEVDLAPYVVAEALTVTTEAEGTSPASDTTVVADLRLQVEATPQGACNAARGAAE